MCISTRLCECRGSMPPPTPPPSDRYANHFAAAGMASLGRPSVAPALRPYPYTLSAYTYTPQQYTPASSVRVYSVWTPLISQINDLGGSCCNRYIYIYNPPPPPSVYTREREKRVYSDLLCVYNNTRWISDAEPNHLVVYRYHIK